MIQKRSPHWLFFPYSRGVMLVGIVCIAFSLWHIQVSSIDAILIMLFILTILSVFFKVTVSLENTSITYHVGLIPTLAAAALYGPSSAVLLACTFEVFLWIFSARKEGVWSKNFEQLFFNVAMQVIAAGGASCALLWTQDQLVNWPQLKFWLPWVPAAIVVDQICLLLLAGIISLQENLAVSIKEIWLENTWSAQLLIFVFAAGGAFLVYAINEFGVPGLIIFYLPILASIYAFKLYTQKMEIHLNRLEEIVAERTSDLEELNRQKNLFLTFLTHDLMTPISSIRISGECINSDKHVSEMGRQHAEIILRSQRSLQNMVSNILDIEKLRVGSALESSMELLLMQDVMINSANILRPEAEDKDLEFKLDIETLPLFVEADYQQIERVLFNLISNSIKYTPFGGEIIISLTRLGDRACVSIEDNGYGIPNEAQPTIFEKNKRVKSLDQKAIGTGLGLAIAREFVTEHQGQLKVESELGEGSIFSFCLPLIKDEDYVYTEEKV